VFFRFFPQGERLYLSHIFSGVFSKNYSGTLNPSGIVSEPQRQPKCTESFDMHSSQLIKRRDNLMKAKPTTRMSDFCPLPSGVLALIGRFSLFLS
jgi:hypothetical protein